MYPANIGTKFLVQQAVSGGGALNGTEYGRARVTLDPGSGPNGMIYVASQLYGTASNAITVELVNAGAGAVVSSTLVQQVGSAIRVILRRSAGAVLANAAEVVAAINNFTAYTGLAFAVRARAGGNGTGLASAVAATAMTGGANPLVDGTQYLWTMPAAQNAGFFHFEHTVPLYIKGLAARFSLPGAGPYTLKLQRVRLNADYTPILAEAVNWWVYSGLTTTDDAYDIAYTDVQQLLHPGQGLLVITSAPIDGFISLDVGRAGEFPY